MNEISSSALLDIQLTLFCVCGVDSFLPELEHLFKNVFTVSFPKRRIRNLGVFLRFWVKAEVNFLRREKHSRREYLDYLKNRAKSGDMAVLELTFRNVSLGKLSKNWSGHRRKNLRASHPDSDSDSPPKKGQKERRAGRVLNVFHKNGMSPIIRSNSTIL